MNRAIVVLAIAGCNSGSATPGPAPAVSAGSGSSSVGEVARLAGPPLYLALCKPCHGADAKGYAADHAPSLVNPTFLESASDEFLRRSIAEGRPGTSMAAYGRSRGGPLDDAAVDRLVSYLRGQGPAAREREFNARAGNESVSFPRMTSRSTRPCSFLAAARIRPTMLCERCC